MLRFFALAATGLVGLTSAACAADLPSPAAPEPAPLVLPYAWSGFYVGVNAGYGFAANGHRPLCVTPGGIGGGPGCAVLPALNTDGDGFVGGGQIGYNQQIGSFLAGIETDIQYTDIARTSTAPGVYPFVGFGAVPVATYSATNRLDYLGTLRARVGYVMDRVLVYATGGLAYGDVRTAQTASSFGVTFASDRTDTEVGFAAGAGVEYGFTPNLTGKAEALYYDLGRRNVSGGSTPATGYTLGARFETAGVIARAGLNYKFNLF